MVWENINRHKNFARGLSDPAHAQIESNTEEVYNMKAC